MDQFKVLDISPAGQSVESLLGQTNSFKTEEAVPCELGAVGNLKVEQ